MLIKQSDYQEIQGIEFLDTSLNFDINESTSPEDIVDILANEFKEEINILNIKFMQDENNEKFKYLRKFYASAIRKKLENHNPMTDKKYVTLKKDIGLGLEKYYYTYMVVPELINQVYTKFFIDSSNKHLYSFQDKAEYRLDGINGGEFNFITWESKIADTIRPDKEEILSDEFMKDVWLNSGMADLFKKTWIDEYNERLGIIFSRIALDSVEESNKTIEKFKNI